VNTLEEPCPTERRELQLRNMWAEQYRQKVELLGQTTSPLFTLTTWNTSMMELVGKNVQNKRRRRVQCCVDGRCTIWRTHAQTSMPYMLDSVSLHKTLKRREPCGSRMTSGRDRWLVGSTASRLSKNFCSSSWICRQVSLLKHT